MEKYDEKVENAIIIVTTNLAKLMNKYAITKNKDESQKLKQKIDLLENIKDEIYQGNLLIIDKVIEKNRKSIL